MRTLRYYDEIGLLKPAHVDQDSGYRSYSIEQLPRLHRILAFKELGFELSQIMQLLAEDVPPAQIRGMLRMKQIELQQRVRAEQDRLARVEARLQQIEMDDQQLVQKVSLKKVKPLIVAVSRKVITDIALKCQFTNELLTFLQQHGVKQTDHPLYIEHENAYSDHGSYSVEIAVPVSSSSVGNIVERSGGRITVRELPGVNTMATLLHYGNPDIMMETYQALGTWIQLHDYVITGPCRKVCLHREGELDNYVTELQFPVERRDHESIASRHFMFSMNGNKLPAGDPGERR
jgi:DNA-binding transcriptional MerR regulator